MQKEMTERDIGETIGVIRALKWVLFLLTYKSVSSVKREVLRFIADEEKRGEQFQNLDSY